MTTGSVATPLLAIELSQRVGGVALIGADGREHVAVVAGGRRDVDELAPAVAAVLAEAELDAASISTVAVDVGPGGFTGLRISVAIGQAIAEAANASVVAVPGAVVALASTPEVAGVAGRALVLSAAKAGTAWGTLFERTDAGRDWTVVGQPGILDGPPSGPLAVVLADEHLDGEFRAAIPREVPIVVPRFDAAALAKRALVGGPGLVVHADPARLQPLYPREPEAVRIWRERHPDNQSATSVPGRG